MKFYLILSVVLVAVSAAQINNLKHTLTEEERVWFKFMNFEREFERKYSSESERHRRFTIFKENLAKIESHNRSGKKTWTEGINKFADWTHEEFRQLLGYKNVKSYGSKGRSESATVASVSPKSSQWPSIMDWRDMGAVTEVKDQGMCGSCWAFATAQMMESYTFLNNNTLIDLSVQHVTSCTPNPLQCGGTGGCYGSIPQLGFNYINQFGLVSDAEWGYEAGSGSNPECSYDIQAPIVKNRGYEVLPRNDYTATMEHLVNKGPLSVAVDASRWGSYQGGVFDNCPYDENIEINHAVQLVGYGTDENLGDYWIVRNSWGPGWGENGYIRLKRNSSPMCGTDSTPLMGVGCVDDGVEVQNVCGTCGILYDVVYPIGADLI